MPPFACTYFTIGPFNVRGISKRNQSRNYWPEVLIVITLMYVASKKLKSKLIINVAVTHFGITQLLWNIFYQYKMEDRKHRHWTNKYRIHTDKQY